MNRLKTLALALTILFATGCSLSEYSFNKQNHKSSKPNTTSSKKYVSFNKKQGEQINPLMVKVDWQGYYYGKIPCKECRGIETWLWLKDVNNTGEYELKQKYLGVKNVTARGGVGWLKNGTVVELFDSSNNEQNKMLFLSGKTASFVEAPDSSVRDSQTLEKLDVFKNRYVSLLVNPKSILNGKINGKKAIKFRGLTNFGIPTPDGYKSLRATYVLHCRDNKFEMSRVSYYKNTFTTGGFIYPKEKLGGSLYPITVKNTIMQDAKKKYCR